MEIEVRPLSTGEVLDRTFRLYRARFSLFVGIATVAALIDTMGSAVQTFAMRYMTQHMSNKALLGGLFGIQFLIEFFIALVAGAVIFAAIARVVMLLHHRETAGIVGALKLVAPRWLRYVVLAIVHWLLSAWPFIVAFFLVIPVSLLAAGGGAKSPEFIAAMLLWVSLMTLSIPVCIWLFCRYALCISVSVIEDAGILKSIKRSVMLSKGLRWRVFLLVAIVYVLQAMIAGVLNAPVFWITFAVLHSHGQMPIPAVIYQLVVGFGLLALIFPCVAIGLTLIYIDARIRKEGFDIELMMQHTGSESPAVVISPQPGDSAPFAMG